MYEFASGSHRLSAPKVIRHDLSESIGIQQFDLLAERGLLVCLHGAGVAHVLPQLLDLVQCEVGVDGL